MSFLQNKKKKSIQKPDSCVSVSWRCLRISNTVFSVLFPLLCPPCTYHCLANRLICLFVSLLNWTVRNLQTACSETLFSNTLRGPRGTAAAASSPPPFPTPPLGWRWQRAASERFDSVVESDSGGGG